MRSGVSRRPSPTSPKCRSRSTRQTRWPLLGERDGEVARRDGLARAALRAEDADERTPVRRPLRASLPRLRAIAFWSACRMRSGVSGRATMSSAPAAKTLLHEAVRVRAVQLEDDDRPLGRELGDPLDQRDRASRLGRAGDDQQIGASVCLAACCAVAASSHCEHLDTAGGQRRPNRIGRDAVLECDERADLAHDFPPNERSSATGGRPSSSVSTVTSRRRGRAGAGRRPENEPELAVVGGEGELLRLVGRRLHRHLRGIAAPAEAVRLRDVEHRDVLHDQAEQRAVPVRSRPAGRTSRRG